MQCAASKYVRHLAPLHVSGLRQVSLGERESGRPSIASLMRGYSLHGSLQSANLNPVSMITTKPAFDKLLLSELAIST